MRIATLINTHGNRETTMDTVDSVRGYMTEDVLLLVEESAWEIFEAESVPMLRGFRHNYHKSPYRNVALGLMTLYDQHPEVDWYCYMEYDCLIGSEGFKEDLVAASRLGVWCMGNDLRCRQRYDMSFVESILGERLDEVLYLLGACLFLSRDFMRRLAEVEFFNKLLFYTNDFSSGFFPGYNGWDLMEHLLPTLASHWGGGVQQFAKWSKRLGWIEGDWRKYAIRWRPELMPEEAESASILHPLKEMGDVRRKFRQIRKIAQIALEDLA